MSITPRQEQAILNAARKNSDRLNTLLQAAIDKMNEAEFDLLCDKVTQILSEGLREARGWKEEVE
jgi:hypothetical protein